MENLPEYCCSIACVVIFNAYTTFLFLTTNYERMVVLNRSTATNEIHLLHFLDIIITLDRGYAININHRNEVENQKISRKRLNAHEIGLNIMIVH